MPNISDQVEKYGEVVSHFIPNSNSGPQNAGIFKINAIKSHYVDGIYELTDFKNNSKELGHKLSEYSGDILNISLESEEDQTILFSKDIYFPKNISAEFENDGRQEFTSRLLVNRDNFLLKWDQDSSNDNGLLVAVMWTNEYMDDALPGNNSSNLPEVQRVLLLDELGNAKIKSDFFDGIPQNGVATLFIMRGEVTSISDSNDNTYQIQAMHEEMFRLALID